MQNSSSFNSFKKLVLMTFILIPPFLSAQERLNSNGKLPIIGWYSITPGEETTVARYQEMKDAGFSISFSFLKNYQD
jgi:hypothetical protein